MSLEDQIRSSLHTAADGARPTPDAWQNVRQSAAARRRRRQTVRDAASGLAAAAVIVGGVVGLAALRDDETGNVTAGPTSTQPREIAAIVDGKVVVLSSADGTIVRTLAEGADADGASTIAVSPDGKTVYFTRVQTDALCELDAPPQIVSVPVDGGPIAIVASGGNPVLSPDGRYIAYASGGPNQCGPTNLLVVQELNTDQFRQQLYEGGEDVLSVEPYGWSVDSQRLLYRTVPAASDDIRTYELEPATGAPPRSISLPEAGGPAVYLGEHTGLAVAVPQSNSAHVLALDPATGASGLLFELSEVPVVTLDADPTGDHVLAVALAPLPDAPPVLTRWSEGEKPRRLLEGVDDAAWVPEAPPPDAPPPTTTAEPSANLAPDVILATTADGRTVELATADGAVLRTEHTPQAGAEQFPEVSRATQGASFFARALPPETCSGTALYRAEILSFGPPSTSEFRGAGRWPAVSPDGARLAYVRGCITPVQLVVRDFAADAERVYSVPEVTDGGPPYELVGPLAWDADSRHLIVPVNREPATEHWYIDVDTATAFADGTRIASVGEQGGPFEFTSLGATGRFAAVVADANDENALRIVELDVVSGTEIRTLVELGDRYGVVASLASDPSGAHLLFVGGDTLYRWSEGDAEPTEVTNDILAADW
ncbi:MAG: TolB family protein [Actinomycetota bacterium]